MISGYGDKNTAAAAPDRGVEKFTTKPVEFPQLKQDITAVIEETQGTI
jgi:DNA-binding NtrC family response regulator